jgi:hypothetical protein
VKQTNKRNFHLLPHELKKRELTQNRGKASRYTMFIDIKEGMFRFI